MEILLRSHLITTHCNPKKKSIVRFIHFSLSCQRQKQRLTRLTVGHAVSRVSQKHRAYISQRPGNKLFAERRYEDAIKEYTSAIVCRHTLFVAEKMDRLIRMYLD